MSLSSWLRSWKLALDRGTSTDRRRRKHHSSYQPRLCLEHLEDRTLLSGWAFSVNGGDAGDVAVDANGNAYVVGNFNSTNGPSDFDPGPGTTNLTSAGGEDVFVAKYRADGTLAWAKQFLGTGSDTGWGIALDPAGNVDVCGNFESTTDFDPGPGSYTLTPAGACVCQLDAEGNFVWARSLGGSGTDAVYQVAVDAGGNLYMAGTFSGTVNFDPGPGTHNLTAAGASDGYVWKLDATGQFVWAQRMGGANYDHGNGLTVANGTVYVTGDFTGSADFGSETLNSGVDRGSDAFLSKLDAASGSFLHSQDFGGDRGGAVGDGVAVDGTGNTYIAGSASGTPDFDPGTGTAYLSTGGFVTELDPSGNYLRAWNVGNLVNKLAIDANNNVYAAGQFKGTVDFDPGPGITSRTSQSTTQGGDVFVAKSDSSGNFLSVWVTQVPQASFNAKNWGIAVYRDPVTAVSSVYNVGAFLGTSCDFDFDIGTGPVTLTSAGGRAAYVCRTIEASAAGISLSPTTLAAATAGASYNATITAGGGTAPYTFAVTSGALPAGLTFSSGGVLSGTPTAVGSSTFTVTATDANGDSGSQAYTLMVNPAAFRVTSFPSPTTAGMAGTFSITALDAYGNTATGYRGTVHITSSDPQAVLPADYTFTAADQGTHTFSATLKTAGSEWIMAADTATSGVTGSEYGIVVNPAAAASLSITGLPASVQAGSASSFTVTAKDVYGNTATGYRGKVHFTSSDKKANLPADYTFASSDNGSHPFTNGVTFQTNSNQTLTATDMATSKITGTATVKVVKSLSAQPLVASSPPLVAANVGSSPTSSSALISPWLADGDTITETNAGPSESSSMAAMMQQADALMLQRLNALLNMEAGAMGMSKDTLMRDLIFASPSSPNGI